MAQTCVGTLRPVLHSLLYRGVGALVLLAALIAPLAVGALQAAGASGALRVAPAWAQRMVIAACSGSGSTARGCDSASLKAIDVSRASEHLPALVLPANFEDLSAADQVIAVTNAERVPRGLPAWHGPVPALARMAVKGVATDQDPNGPAGTTWASNLATGVLTVLEADFDWMYNDGPGGTNSGCTVTTPGECWSHRANVLSPWAGTIGAAGQAARDRRLVLAEVMVAGMAKA
jgi:hypothetical protein